MNTIQRDTQDARRELSEQALLETAREINERHKANQERVEGLRNDAIEICTEAIAISKLVGMVHANLGGRRFKEWWDAQKLPVGWAGKYLTLDKTSDRHTLGDKDQMRLVGILPEAESNNEGTERPRTGYEWTKYVGKLASSLTVQDIERMGQAEKRMAYDKLKPLADLFKALAAQVG